MKIYEIIIKPKSGFATPLKGDTVFGNLCWHIHYNEKVLNISLSSLLENYSTSPFLVVSSAFGIFNDIQNTKNYIFKRPDVPEDFLFGNNNAANRKENTNKKYFIFNCAEKLPDINKIQYKTQKEILVYSGEYDAQTIISRNNVTHNSINRLTFTTGGEKEFAPYTSSIDFYTEKINPVIFAAVDESRFSKESLELCFKNLGFTGFGKDASIGCGQFEVVECIESSLLSKQDSGGYLYALGPFVPLKEDISDLYFQPFTRFGKHGESLAKSKKPFKKPVIMADEGAIIKAVKPFDKNYPILGSAVCGISDVDPNAVTQGYALCMPVNLQEGSYGK